MRFEKLNENKIRITLSNEDLKEKKIDFHSFMSNSIESQDLFFDMLKEAEKEIGFITKNYLVKLEALALSNGTFILTVTRTLPDISKTSTFKSSVNIKRKKELSNASQMVYIFNTFESYCAFVNFLKNNNYSLNNISKHILLYEYKNTYYLIFDKINMNYPFLKKLLFCISEFATYKNSSEIFIRKLYECGNLVMKNNALNICLKYFGK